MFAGAFAAAASMMPAGVFTAATAQWSGTPTTDSGGSITAPGSVTDAPCRVQFDRVTDQMRSDADFVERDVRMLVIGIAALDDKARIIVASGERTGTWSIRSIERDPAGIGWDCRGRRA